MNLPTQNPLTRAGLFMEDQSAHSGAICPPNTPQCPLLFRELITAKWAVH